ncbi:butyrate kinase [Desulforamulus hydrothermalis]|uniref:Probable butyrate kinase n=1 Tax=Desulforamulus hydrothermalis Lam5 = DSM 18033 TaxID=1121428 RepID=K8DXR7_9FIRM|nr:butyrate kinase [Desulforamulus hydrothermalis]CCO07419.1 putative butyrate kinase 1 [Desulforamulus hydrothermalis Lam5 = DSM 18033]SHH36121.1 butyrate kinase [Desulforamulus hydrothermalis Lam5 = DSM 18033]
MQILAINPGSTSTKIAVFQDETCLWKKVIDHPEQDIRSFAKISDQFSYRMAAILKTLQEKNCRLADCCAVVGRGGLLNPLAGGTYLVDEYLVQVSHNAPGGEHASNLGAIIAYHLAQKVNIPAYIVDPVAVDEMEPVARLSGHPELPRISLSHALNMKAVARKVARQLGKTYQEVNLVIAHLGSGISVSPHRRGRMIDVNNANNEGPFSPERCGTLPSAQLVKLCYSGKYTEKEMLTGILKEGGMYAYLGTKDAREAERRMNQGDRQARLVLEAMCYQVAKEIGAMSAVLCGDVDRIVLTGGLAHSAFITDEITRRVSFIAPVVSVPGEEEMASLALGALRVLRNEEPALIYR